MITGCSPPNRGLGSGGHKSQLFAEQRPAKNRAPLAPLMKKWAPQAPLVENMVAPQAPLVRVAEIEGGVSGS